MGVTSFNYTPGDYAALVAWPVCALARLPPSDPRIGAAYAALTNDPTPQTALEQLADIDPNVGVLTVTPTGSRLVMRGSIRGFIDGGEIMWAGGPVDVPVGEISSASLMVDGPVSGLSLPVAYGVVGASRVGLGWTPEDAPQDDVVVTALVPQPEPLPLPPTHEPAGMVAAVMCPAGHANPVYVGRCRVCQSSIPVQPLVRVPRPMLGVLRTADGLEVSLDKPAVIGRNPQPRAAGDVLVRVDDPGMDVSNQHLAVEVADWLVTVCDLGSTNGTQVLVPGRAPLLLRPGEPVAIEPGAVVVLAHVFELVYEAR